MAEMKGDDGDETATNEGRTRTGRVATTGRRAGRSGGQDESSEWSKNEMWQCDWRETSTLTAQLPSTRRSYRFCPLLPTPAHGRMLDPLDDRLSLAKDGRRSPAASVASENTGK